MLTRGGWGEVARLLLRGIAPAIEAEHGRSICPLPLSLPQKRARRRNPLPIGPGLQNGARRGKAESQPGVIRGAGKGLVQWFESATFTHTATSSTLTMVRKRWSQDHRSLRFRGREACPRRTAMARSRPPRTCPASGQTRSPRTVFVPGRRNRPLRTYGGSLRNRGPLMIDGRALLIAEAI